VSTLLDELATGKQHIPLPLPSSSAAAPAAAAAAAAATEPLIVELSSADDDVQAGQPGVASEPVVLAGNITLLSPGCTESLVTKPSFQKLFHVVYFDCHSAHLLTPAVRALFHAQCRVVLETAKYLVDLTPEQRKAFADKLIERAGAAGLKLVASEDVLLADVLVFEM
jgi:uncharacterized membrane protein